jgi:hypothetical protein
VKAQIERKEGKGRRGRKIYVKTRKMRCQRNKIKSGGRDD